MNARLHHENNKPECPLCDFKLELVHSELRAWYYRKKAKYISLHVSDSWRGPREQDLYYSTGKSNARWPNSKHNHMQDNKPLSLAVDLFQLDDDGNARWSPPFMTKLAGECVNDRDPIYWGGHIKLRGGGRDYCHFELKVKDLDNNHDY